MVLEKKYLIMLLLSIIGSLNLLSQNIQLERNTELKFNNLNDWLDNCSVNYKIPKSFDDLNQITQILFASELSNIRNKMSDEFLSSRILYPTNDYNISFLKINISDILNPNCVGQKTFKNKLTHFIGLIFKEEIFKENKSLSRIIYTDILLSSTLENHNFLLRLLFKLSFINETPIEKCFIEANCQDDNSDPFMIYWDDGLKISSNEKNRSIDDLKLNYMTPISKEYIAPTKNTESDFLKIKKEIYLQVHSIIKTILVDKYGKQQVYELGNNPSQFTIKNIKNIVTHNDGYWENITFSVYKVNYRDSYFMISGFSEATFYDSKTIIPPNNNNWLIVCKSTKIDSNYSENLINTVMIIYDSIWLKIKKHIFFN